MRKKLLLLLTTVLVGGAVSLSLVESHRSWAQTELRRSVERKHEEYRTAVKDAYKIDINNFTDRLPGGHADGKPVIRSDLKQLLAGINFERDHTKDNLIALELAMDHLESNSDYYTRFERMEWECRSEKLGNR